ncbi:(2Fe-2S)-binding protein [Kitasatospora sp. NPDC090308]|uniref:(2Fe-2S)-binding protein n=1 Tax=Kitasatospora sp. NPDC090308 TaxID=3364082 RepID=UPI00382364E8
MTDELLNHPGALTADVRPTASYTLRVNGVDRPVTDAWIGESLLYVLRERLGLAGAKDGCEQGECGACSIQVDGQLVNGCLVPAALAADSEINTVEGLSGAGGASDVQQALADSGAVQCGYCTPGMAMAVHDLLQRNHRPGEVEARQALCGNLCRCTGYRGALAAVQAVADAREAALEAELEAAEQAAGQAPPAGAPAAGPPSYPDQAGELPLYADSELWHEADQPAPPAPPAGQDDGTLRTGGYAYPPTPPHGTPVPADWAADPGAPGGAGAPGPFAGPGGTDPFGTTAYQDAGPYDGTVYATDGYGQYPGHDATGYDATPAHGIRLHEDENA